MSYDTEILTIGHALAVPFGSDLIRAQCESDYQPPDYAIPCCFG